MKTLLNTQVWKTQVLNTRVWKSLMLIIALTLTSQVNASDKDKTPNLQPKPGLSTSGAGSYQSDGPYGGGSAGGQVVYSKGRNAVILDGGGDFRTRGCSARGGDFTINIRFNRKYRALVRNMILAELAELDIEDVEV